MKIEVGYLTPWGISHGIAQYSYNLIHAIKDEVQLRVVGFELNEQGKADIENDAVLEDLDSCGLIHFQFEQSLYDMVGLQSLILRFVQAGKKVVCTAHNRSIWPGFPVNLVDRWIVHHLAEGGVAERNVSFIPIGVTFWDKDISPKPRTVVTFGDKNDTSVIREALDKVGGGVLEVSNGWKPISKLIDALYRGCAVVLMYPGTEDIQYSKAAILASGIKRPLIVSDIPEFNHIARWPGVAPAKDAERLSINLEHVFSSASESVRYVVERRSYIEREKLTLRSSAEKHIKLYSDLLS